MFLLESSAFVLPLSHIRLFGTRGLEPTRLLCPWDSPAKNTGVGCHFLLRGTFPDQRLHPHLLHWQAGSLLLSRQGNPWTSSGCHSKVPQTGWRMQRCLLSQDRSWEFPVGAAAWRCSSHKGPLAGSLLPIFSLPPHLAREKERAGETHTLGRREEL